MIDLNDVTFEQQADGTFKQVDDPPKRADMVAVVRCRDCRHYRDHMWVVVTDVDDVCLFWHGEPTKVEPNGFCAWGERRDA